MAVTTIPGIPPTSLLRGKKQPQKIRKKKRLARESGRNHDGSGGRITETPEVIDPKGKKPQGGTWSVEKGKKRARRFSRRKKLKYRGRELVVGRKEKGMNSSSGSGGEGRTARRARTV